MTKHPAAHDTIGVFDSGVGGLSVLRALHARLRQARLHYVADSLYAPYGDRSTEEVVERSQRLAQHLLDAGARMIVVACNTATTVAIRTLRARWPEVPFVGVEPGIKPAVARSPNGRIGVLATSRTIASERLRFLVSEHASRCSVVLQACPGLVDAIEGGDAKAEHVDRLLQRYCEPLRASQVDTVVLGCTHYPFVGDRIRSIMGLQVQLIDTADAVAQRAQSLCCNTPDIGATLPQKPMLQTTGEPDVLTMFSRRWIDPSLSAERVTV